MAAEIDVSEHSPQFKEYAAAAPAQAATICNVCKEKSQVLADNSCTELYDSSMKEREGVVNFDCSICFDMCRNPVVTMCGHLFCWSCLNCWLSLHCMSQECPVCKADVGDKIIPIYGCGKEGCSKSMMQKFSDIHTSPCRSSHSQSIAQSTPTIANYGAGFLCRRTGRMSANAASMFVQSRGRLHKERVYVLHWAFICVASCAIVYFLAN